MTRQRTRSPGWIAYVTALPAVAVAMGAQAQVSSSVQDFSLPPASPTPAPAPAGPVDSDHPVIAPPRAAPTLSPVPAPVIVLPAPIAPAPDTARDVVTRPQARRGGPQGVPEPSRARVQRPAGATSAPTPAAAPMALPVPAVPTPPDSARPLAPVDPVADSLGTPWPWIATGATVVLLLAGLLAWRRRSQRATAAYHRAEPDDSAPHSSPPAALTPAADIDRTPPPSTAEPQELDMQLEARHLSRALVNTSLAYRLTLVNRGAASIGPLRIAGDIVSAHATLSSAEQLDPDATALSTIHEVPAITPGESISLSGELRLPIANILPIHSGDIRLFVPLARFRVEAEARSATTRVFVIGRASDAPGAALRPFPLDRGPGIDRAIGQRELAVSA